jgi:hypothetical protein
MLLPAKGWSPVAGAAKSSLRHKNILTKEISPLPPPPSTARFIILSPNCLVHFRFRLTTCPSSVHQSSVSRFLFFLCPVVCLQELDGPSLSACTLAKCLSLSSGFSGYCLNQCSGSVTDPALDPALLVSDLQLFIFSLIFLLIGTV